jgi:hypothetical protein
MVLTLSDKEASVILGATLMHWGVPFHFTTKHVLTEPEQELLDELSERLISIRNTADQEEPIRPLFIAVSDEERRLLIEVLSACLAECGDNLMEISLHLKAGSKDEVVALIERLRQSS